MGDPVCDIVLEGGVFRPGETLHGTVKCNFQSETKVRSIKVKFKGKAKVSWREQRTTYKSSETYFAVESEMLSDETTFPPGSHAYPFSFTLPDRIPTSLSDEIGKILYSIKASINRPWAFDYTSKKYFAVENVWDLNTTDSVKPMEYKKQKYPFSIKTDPQPITLSVVLPFTGFIPTQLVSFKANLKNESHVNVKGVQFQLVQGFHFHTEWKDNTVAAIKSEELAVVDGSVPAGNEKSWDLQLRVPQNVHNGIYEPCQIIKPFFELRGEVILPFLYKNSKILIPLSLGTIAVDTTKE